MMKITAEADVKFCLVSTSPSRTQLFAEGQISRRLQLGVLGSQSGSVKLYCLQLP